MNRQSRGAALIELLVTFGILSTLAFGGFELTKMLESAKAVTNLSREAANTVKRECVNGSKEEITACADGVAKKIVAVADEMMNNYGPYQKWLFSNYGCLRIIVWKDPNPGDNRPGDVPVMQGQALDDAPIVVTVGNLSPSPSTKYDGGKFSETEISGGEIIRDDFKWIYNNEANVVVSEVYFRHTPVTGFLFGLFRGNAGEHEIIYATTLI